MSPHPTHRTRHSVGGEPLHQNYKGFKLAMQMKTPPTVFTPEQLLRAVKGWCWDCGEIVANYLVHNEVWEEAWPKEVRIGTNRLEHLKKAATKAFPERKRSPDSNMVYVHVHLCFSCLELRLGRPLKMKDFVTVTRKGKVMAVNAGIFLGYKLGYKAGMRAAKKAAESGDKKDEGG